MSFLRRLLGGADDGAKPPASPAGQAGPRPSATTVEDDEAERDRAILREDAARLSDDLLARQLRYADRKWTPPAQGGPQRSGDAAADNNEGT